MENKTNDTPNENTAANISPDGASVPATASLNAAKSLSGNSKISLPTTFPGKDPEYGSLTLSAG